MGGTSLSSEEVRLPDLEVPLPKRVDGDAIEDQEQEKRESPPGSAHTRRNVYRLRDLGIQRALDVARVIFNVTLHITLESADPLLHRALDVLNYQPLELIDSIVRLLLLRLKLAHGVAHVVLDRLHLMLEVVADVLEFGHQ